MGYNLIDNILTQRDESQKEAVAQKQSHIPVLNAQNIFLTEDNPTGIISKTSYQKTLQKFNREGLLALKSFYNSLRNNEKLQTAPFPRVDKKGENYYWLTFTGRNGKKEFKLPEFDGLYELIELYLSGNTSIEIDFDTLYEESISS